MKRHAKDVLIKLLVMMLLVASVQSASAQAQGIAAGSAEATRPLSDAAAAGSPSQEVLQLRLSDAIDHAMRQNLRVLLGTDAVVSAQGESWQERSRLLPNLSARTAETAAQINLAAQGFQKLASHFPGGGSGFPLVVGPFGYFDLRAYFSQALLDLDALHSQRAAARNLAAEQLSLQDIRELVALVVGAAYVDTIAASARVETTEAQVQTAQALYNQAVDMRTNGLTAGIDLLRAQVELQTRRQELIAARNELAKQNLVLARAIGLPLGQEFRLADAVPFEAPAAPALGDSLARAFASRADFQSAEARVNSAQERLRAAAAEHLPTLTANTDYGVIGPTPGQTHGSFSASAALRIPIFAGNKAHGDALVAQAELDQNRHRLEDLRAQIEQDVRSASLDLQAAADRVAVAQSTEDLAQQTLAQSRDRFSAGVTDNIEVVQAQEAVVRANEAYISSLRDFNLARMQLARAIGSAERHSPVRKGKVIWTNPRKKALK